MASSNLEKFKKRQALVAYFRHVFGVEDVNEPESVREYYRSLRAQPEGYDNEGRSHVYNAIKGRVRGIDSEALLTYDENVKRHTEKLNRNRTDEITLKYFQVLPALMTEHYLDRLDKNPQAFARDVNEFLEEQDEERGGRIDYPRFEPSDLNKLAYWMATGSGKTLLMHINYYQYLDYFPDSFDNIILVTPNEGLSHQHIKEMKKSGITGYRFNAATTDLYRHDPEFVKVIEITKLTEDKEGEGQSIEVSSFEGRNLVFADEGHKGAGGEAWMENRKRLADEGFTFEYSATFGQGIAGSGVDLEEEYGQSIIFDYSYPRFYEDGYGKDYRILNLDNLEDGIGDELRDRYMLANLLSFYEQVRCYEGNEDVFYSTYNVRRPLLVFVGHTVQAGKTRSNLSKSDETTLSDVQDIVRFLSKVLGNEDGWVPETIGAILDGNSGITDADDRDLFSSFLRVLREEQPEGKAVYADMLRDLFHADSPGTLHLVDIEDAQGEIGLRAGTSDEFFGVINIGNDRGFLDDAEEKLPDIQVGSQKFRGSLFELIQERDSPIQTLIGAKKFIEGWDSWRVSTMGLMNIGRGEGPQIIQLFGRGVRLEGKDKTLKRSEELDGDHPEELPTLETLNIFGIRADYMAQFRDYLAEEGIDTEPRRSVEIETKVNDDFQGKGLLVVRPEEGLSFVDETSLELEVAPDYGPVIDLAPQGDLIVSQEGAGPGGGQAATESIEVPEAVLPLLDWHEIYREIWGFRQSRGYYNLILPRETLRRVIEDHHYDLRGREDLLEIEEYADLSTVQRVVSMILSKYVDNFYGARKREFEMERLTYHSLEEDVEGEGTNIPEKITARVKASAEDFLQTLEEKRDDPELYEDDDGLPDRVHFDRHLYVPLLIAEDSDDPSVKYSPPGLNPGEAKFVRDMKEFFEGGDGDELLEDWEIFLLRNRSRGHGVGFLAGDYNQKFFPDFILWFKGDQVQHVAFVDPKGLQRAGSLDANPKVQFANEIKEYQKALNEKAGRDDIVLSSLIVSVSDFDALRKQSGMETREEFHNGAIFFEDDEISQVISAIVDGQINGS